MSSSISWRACSLATAVLLAALAGGCGSAQQASSGARVVDVTERDFSISTSTTLAAGEITFRVHNAGPDEHEFIVMRGTAAELPLQNDGLTVNETAASKRLVGELEPGAPGLTRDLRLKLAPGRYVFYCDMTGHFMGGMHTDVVVQ
jgi:uncharacterized cupredoxin-like copper-binding protein